MGSSGERELLQFVDTHLRLLHLEWEHEFKEKDGLYDGLTYQDLIEEGVVLTKLEVESCATRNCYYEVVFSLNSQRKPNQQRINLGDAVSLHDTKYHDKVIAKGVIEDTTEDTITVSFLNDPSLSDENKYGIRSDNKSEITYKRLERTLFNMRRTPRGPMIVLRNVMFGSSKLEVCPLPPELINEDGNLKFINEKLHNVQKKAVEFALKQTHLAIIHGPPGTGKTTTLIEIIQQLTSIGNKILVCAPSNIAVDCLVEKLFNTKTKYLRLGHPARMLHTIKDYSLDATLASGSVAQIQNDIKKDICECQRRLSNLTNNSEKHQLYVELRHLKREYYSRRNNARKQALSEANVVLTTLTSANNDGPMSSLPSGCFDVVIIDECSQAMEVACWIALPWAQKVILAGDHLQLPPPVRCKEAIKGGLGYSLMERAIKKFGKKSYFLLTHQFRMHNDIMYWVSQQMYAGKLTVDPSVEKHLLKDIPGVKETDETGTSMVFIDTAGCDMEEEGIAKSRCNNGEANVIALLVDKLLDAGVHGSSIAVITPYTMQVRCIRSILIQHSEVEVRTVDGFQGREKECVLLSLVRSNIHHDLGFLVDHRRLNVAVSRARRFLGVVADSSTVYHDSIIKSLLLHIEKYGIYHSAHNYLQGCNREMKKFVVKLQASSKQHNVVKGDNTTSVMQTSKEKSSSYPMKFENKVDPQQLNVDEVDYWKCKLREIMINNGGEKYTFPTTLTSFERMNIHNAAEMLGLDHHSSGEGMYRNITICKSSVATLGETKSNETKLVSESNNYSIKNISNVEQNAILSLSEERHPVFKTKCVPTKKGSKQPSSCGTTSSGSNYQKYKKRQEPEDFDSLLHSFEKLNNTCSNKGCKKSTKLMGQNCEHCKQIYCLQHALPEIHGCAEAACRAAKRDYLKPKPISDPDRKKASAKLKKNISNMSDTRKPQKRGK